MRSRLVRVFLTNQSHAQSPKFAHRGGDLRACVSVWLGLKRESEGYSTILRSFHHRWLLTFLMQCCKYVLGANHLQGI